MTAAPSPVHALVEHLCDDLTVEDRSGTMHMMFKTEAPSLIGHARFCLASRVGMEPLEQHAAKPDVRQGHGPKLAVEAPTQFNTVLREIAAAV